MFIFFFVTEIMPELLDLPDELILNIMDKVKPQFLLLCSTIGIGSDRLEQLALDQCQSIDLTSLCMHSSQELVLERFYSYVLPCIHTNIKSLTINLEQLQALNKSLELHCDGVLPNLVHLKIVRFYHSDSSGTPAAICKL